MPINPDPLDDPSHPVTFFFVDWLARERAFGYTGGTDHCIEVTAGVKHSFHINTGYNSVQL